MLGSCAGTGTAGGNVAFRILIHCMAPCDFEEAQARIIGSSVIQAVQDSAQIGTVNPGETKTSSFVISATAALAGKQYVLDSEIKYRDELGSLMLSDTMSFGVDVVQPTGLDAVLSSPVAIIVTAGAIVLIVYAAWKLKGRKKGGKNQDV